MKISITVHILLLQFNHLQTRRDPQLPAVDSTVLQQRISFLMKNFEKQAVIYQRNESLHATGHQKLLRQTQKSAPNLAPPHEQRTSPFRAIIDATITAKN